MRGAAQLGMATAALAGVLLAAGCGVPTSSDVRVVGPPPEAEQPWSEAELPPGPDEAGDEAELVDHFLEAAAGDPAEAVEELRAFIASDVRDGWEPDSQVYVARETDVPLGTPGEPYRVELRVRRVGQLSSDGVIDPRVQDEEVVTLHVITERDPEAEDGGVVFRILDPPPFVLLSERALQQHFTQRRLYFWDSDGEKLVADLRWLPNAVPPPQRPQQVVEWLLAGPARWLSGAVAEVPDGVELDGNVRWSEDGQRLEILLTAPHDEVNLRGLDAQLWWTLHPEIVDAGLEVALLVDGEQRQLGGTYRSDNPIPTEAPASFVIMSDELWQYAPDTPESIPGTSEDEGEGEAERVLARAAVSRTGDLAALVRTDPAGNLRLAVADQAGVTEIDRVATQMGRPVWLGNPPGTGLVPADGDLYQFGFDEDDEVQMLPVELAELPGEVTAVAAAPDGRRLALVAGGRLHVASVTRAGGVVSVSRHQQLPTTATELAGVAFLREDRLAVVGAADRQSRLYQLTVDGAVETELPGGDQVGDPEQIRNFVAYPGDPEDADDRGTIMYEADGLTYRYTYPGPPFRIEAVDLPGYESQPDVEDPDPQAPFFLD